MDEVRKLVTDKLAEKGLTMKDGSLAMGRAHTFLYQFLKRGIPNEIHERDRPKLAAILGVPADALRGPGKPVPPRPSTTTKSEAKKISKCQSTSLRTG